MRFKAQQLFFKTETVVDLKLVVILVIYFEVFFFRVLSGMNLLPQSGDLIYSLSSGLLCWLGYRSRKEFSGIQNMVTFFPVMVPSEMAIHFLALQLLVTYKFFPNIKKFIYSLEEKLSTRKTSKLIFLKENFAMIFGIIFNFFSVLIFGNLFYHNLKSISLFRNALSKAGVKQQPRKFKLLHLVALILPLWYFLSWHIQKKTKVYGIVPKTLNATENTKKLKLDIYWHKKTKFFAHFHNYPKHC